MQVDEKVLLAALQGGYENFEGVALEATRVLNSDYFKHLFDNIYSDGETTIGLFDSNEELKQWNREKERQVSGIVVTDGMTIWLGSKRKVEVQDGRLRLTK